ncbi:MAG: hypothetical protein Q8Q09_06045 [Deltaproteobacteria bacterium]|nr:hypothetical protein [Deltaproteobacteria bacterium]
MRHELGHALADAWAEGWEVSLQGDRLRVRPRSPSTEPRGSEGPWRAFLRTHALDAIAELCGPCSAPQGDLDWEERAAILEHDAGLSRVLAERVAWLWR